MPIRQSDFDEMFHHMEMFSRTKISEHGRRAWEKGDEIDFPVGASRSQIQEWSNAFHKRWKKSIDFAPRGRG